MSERVEIGKALELELAGRAHRPSAETKENFPDFPQGQTRDLAAKAAGFGNGKTYEQASNLCCAAHGAHQAAQADLGGAASE